MISTMVAVLLALTARLRSRIADDRGDVPGWVLITIMTAGIVSVLWGIAGDTLASMLSSALSSVAP